MNDRPTCPPIFRSTDRYDGFVVVISSFPRYFAAS